jgi:integrase
MNDRRRDSETPIRATFEQYLTDKGKGDGGGGGNYRRNVERVLGNFHDWATGAVADEVNADGGSWAGVADGEPTFDDVDATVFGDYARHLRHAHAKTTARTYYDYVASWSKWAHRQGYIESHYARKSEAEDPLPTDDGRESGDQQAWTPRIRDELTRYVDERAEAAIDDWAAIDGRNAPNENAKARYDAVVACRTRALAYVLAYTGLRLCEFLDDPHDDRRGRNGLAWEDVAFEDNAATVYRKRQAWTEASLPDPVVPPLKRYRDLLDPPQEWPVFVTLHRPTLSSHVTVALQATGLTDEEVEDRRDDRPDLLVAADEDLPPPPATKTSGGREAMRRLSDRADLSLACIQGDYLEPHGGRRGMGEVMVRTHGYAAAARFLDNSEAQVRAAYQHIEAAERADKATEAIAATDQRVRHRDD